jgi:hypothetical protein
MEDEVKALLRRPTISVDDAALVLGIGRNSAYAAVRNGDVESMAVGKRRLVLTAPLRRKLGISEVA